MREANPIIASQSTAGSPSGPATGSAAGAAAGQAWRVERQAGGSWKRLVPDFLVAAHAAHHADRLLTRDRGFHRRALADLEILDPSA